MPLGDPSAEPATARKRQMPRRRDTRFFVPGTRLPDGLPSWFHTQDHNGDGQISMAEYSPEVTATSMASFHRYDRNGDGVVTVEECTRNTSRAKAVTTTPARQTPSALKASPPPPPKKAAAPATDSANKGSSNRSNSRSLMQYDKDADGKISEAEAPSFLKRYFTRYDKDGDGFLTTPELDALRSRFRSRDR